ncbi:MAG: DNA-binding domain-containing protein [Anaerovoracaceae bacterium]
MRYYIVDDNIGVIKTLENLIEANDFGKVVGYEDDSEQAITQILALAPDIVLVDLLMSKMDGISLVKKIRKENSEISFVMISQVTDKKMVASAYEAGVEFYISKPINIIEVENVIEKVSQKIKMEELVFSIRKMTGNYEINESLDVKAKGKSNSDVKAFLGVLGMLGEKGSNDLLEIVKYLLENKREYSKEVLSIVSKNTGDKEKNVEQRIRRAIKKGLTNAANLALDDYGNEVLQEYCGYVFDFTSIKEEMALIKNQNNYGGRVNISKFVHGLLTYLELKEKDIS